MASAIEVENLGKRYLLGHLSRRGDDTLRDRLTSIGRQTIQRIRHPFLSAAADEVEEFWALRDVSFSVQPGERLGVIGRNGAGKSTLLKILSRITEPTTGRFKTNGRVSSLLEVGTGFHPELSGRENIFLNGAILGMSHGDIRKKFDEIVAFAEIEKFLDTPVKRYSSGMYVRLAFSVAAHLEPEILIVDEVLAVGDSTFQKKCLGKMEDVGKEGRTVVFVSHNLSAVRRLCNRGIWLADGRLIESTGAIEAVEKYQSAQANLMQNASRDGYVRSVTMESGGKPCCSIGFGEPLNVVVETEGVHFSQEVGIAVIFRTETGDRVSTLNSFMRPFSDYSNKRVAVASFPHILLLPGKYIVEIVIFVNKGATMERVNNAAELTVFDSDFFENGTELSRHHGVAFLDGTWALR